VDDVDRSGLLATSLIAVVGLLVVGAAIYSVRDPCSQLGRQDKSSPAPVVEALGRACHESSK